MRDLRASVDAGKLPGYVLLLARDGVVRARERAEGGLTTLSPTPRAADSRFQSLSEALYLWSSQCCVVLSMFRGGAGSGCFRLARRMVRQRTAKCWTG